MRYFTVATAGHVDHGKTSLLCALTGYNPDRLKEEKERQMTTDLGFAHMVLPDAMGVGFIDVPGHGKFLKNMLAGVGGIDLALLVVAADEGPMPQTKQHLKILALLGIRNVIVCATKIDLVEQEHADKVIEATLTLLEKYGILHTGHVFLSSKMCTGFEQLKVLLRNCLGQLPRKEATSHLFLPIDRVFTKTGFGTVVTGTLVRGQISPGDLLTIEPGGIKTRVRRLESFGKPVEIALPGQRVAANLAYKDASHLYRGQVLLTGPSNLTSNLVVSISGFEATEGRLIDQGANSSKNAKAYKDGLHLAVGANNLRLLVGRRVRLYHGTAECHGSMHWVEPAFESPDTVEHPIPSCSIAGISLSKQIVAQPGDHFVVRFEDDTVLGGKILFMDRPRWMKRLLARKMYFHLNALEYAQATAFFLNANSQWLTKETQLRRFVPEKFREAIISSMISKDEVIKLDDCLLWHATFKRLSKCIIEELAVTSGSKPVSMETLRLQIKPEIDRAVFQHLISDMVLGGIIAKEGDLLWLPGARPSIEDEERRILLCSQITEILAGHVLLEMTELSSLLKVSKEEIIEAVKRLSQIGLAQLVAYEFVGLTNSLNNAHELLWGMWQRDKGISPGKFREGLGTSRKYAMALLEYFDDCHITRRLREGRVVLKEPERFAEKPK